MTNLDFYILNQVAAKLTMAQPGLMGFIKTDMLFSDKTDAAIMSVRSGAEHSQNPAHYAVKFKQKCRLAR